jgi:uncharacterized protein YgiB involved in biofilm formation
MTDRVKEMVGRLRAWSHDERLGDGMLLREAADMLAELREENEALRQFYNGVGDCIDDTWQCERCGNSEPWWTDTNADYLTRDARAAIAALEPRK